MLQLADHKVSMERLKHTLCPMNNPILQTGTAEAHRYDAQSVLKTAVNDDISPVGGTLSMHDEARARDA